MTKTSWTITVEEDSESCFLPLPDDLLEQLDWDEDTIIEMIDNGDGSWTLRKVNDPEAEA